LIKKKRSITIHHIPITRARINLGQVARRAHVNKEYFILEKDGIPLVGLMNADELEDYLELLSAKVRADIHKSTREYQTGKTRKATEFLAELVAEGETQMKRRRSR
jgi:hypothetical protein